MSLSNSASSMCPPCVDPGLMRLTLSPILKELRKQHLEAKETDFVLVCAEYACNLDSKHFFVTSRVGSIEQNER